MFRVYTKIHESHREMRVFEDRVLNMKKMFLRYYKSLNRNRIIKTLSLLRISSKYNASLPAIKLIEIHIFEKLYFLIDITTHA